MPQKKKESILQPSNLPNTEKESDFCIAKKTEEETIELAGQEVIIEYDKECQAFLRIPLKGAVTDGKLL